MYNVENILRNYSFIFIDIKFVLDTLWTYVLTFLKYIIQIDAFSLRCDKKRRRMLEKYQRENEGKRQLTDNGHGVDDDGESNDSGTIGPRAQMLIMMRVFNQTACLQLNLQISSSIWFWRRASSRNNNLRLSEA